MLHFLPNETGHLAAQTVTGNRHIVKRNTIFIDVQHQFGHPIGGDVRVLQGASNVIGARQIAPIDAARIRVHEMRPKDNRWQGPALSVIDRQIAKESIHPAMYDERNRFGQVDFRRDINVVLVHSDEAALPADDKNAVKRITDKRHKIKLVQGPRTYEFRQ